MISVPLFAKGARFLIVGSIGFIVDAGTLWIANTNFGLNPYLARLISFSTALMITWILNNHVTFKSHEKRGKKHFAAYICVQGSSFCLNYFVYSSLIWLELYDPISSLAIASIIAMFFSFTAMNIWVFKEAKPNKK